MADNVAITSGSGTTVATDEIGGVHYQLNKVVFGALDTATLVSAANPLPVTNTTLPTGAATDATLTGGTQRTKLTDGTNNVGVADSSTAASETATDRLKVNAGLRLLDTAQVAGSQLVAAKGDQTTGLWVNVKNASLPVTGTFWQATQPVSGTFWQATQPVSIATMPSTPVTGTFWQATQPVSLATNTPTIAAGSAIIGKVGIDQTTPGTTNLVQVGGSLPTGANTIGAVNIAAAQTIAATQATAANLNATVTPVTPSTSIVNSAATTNATLIKGSAGTVYSVTVSNAGAAAAFVKLYNLAAAPTVGTSTIALTIPVGASSVVNIPFGENGVRFGTGIGLAITNLVAETDTTAVAANQVKVVTSYI